MHILALVEAEFRPVFEITGQLPLAVHFCQNCGTFLRRAAHNRSVTLVVDPTLAGETAFVAMLPPPCSHAGGVLLLARSHRDSFKRVCAAGRAGLQHVVLCDREVDPTLLRVQLAQARHSSALGLLFTKLAACLERLRDPLNGLVLGLLAGGPVPQSVIEFVARGARNRRTVHNQLNSAGLAGTRAILVAAQLARTWEPFATSGAEVSAVAKACAYRSVEQMREHFRKVFGGPPTTVVSQFTVEAFADRLASHAMHARSPGNLPVPHLPLASD